MTPPPRRPGRPRQGHRAGRRPRPQLDGARLTAYDVLDAVSSRAAYANLLLPQLLRERQLDQRDAAFTTQLAYGALRAQGTLDEVLTGLVSRPLAELDPRVLDLLRLGAYQLLDLRVPAHAAVDTTVDLTRAIVGTGASGLVNAVLRKVAAGGDRVAWLDRLAGDADGADGDRRLALATDHPGWIVAAWREALDAGDPSGAPELEAALLADDAAPEVHLVARRLARDRLAEESGGTPGPWSPYAVRLAGGDPGKVPAVREGTAAVQDEGSQLAALLLTRAPLDGLDAAWLDMCAGPGGKAGLLAAVRPEGVRLTAADRSPHRAELVRAALGDAAGTEVVVADGRQPPWAPGSFDRVLLDAPCTGLGALRRRPEVRWRRTPADVPPLVELQTALLDGALASVRPGGVVAYVTCSPHTAETVGVVEAAAARDDVEVLPVAPLFPEVPGVARGRYGQLWPHRHGTDAMFMALLRRTS
ncbi:RsmB/NOP family class I SAM-dependent RNA methyltransferase [Geodermatophilus sabuli]|uniref:16S rRNA (Cytosine967-C5)-methyltransferase n=1 Tax=Geodermatophilus sabuli TaxID=1564158 RepID=A0A285E7W4_9ACTN|nr:transcription antitermination factor NusB [Geodermatophilus sabuli]MBB3081910.1 16S rRNA (cytosine967-C5)-methyltransferase [Geodermatophilus sabuli]SNX95218.1 16S rRNA (cytosine967-C5)-methyltransferase [Geodermatophilus sabuli]